LASSLGISYAELIAGLLVISLPTVATEAHNAAGLLNGILEIAISRDREGSAAK
jgi:HSP20 family molecular chaperone IbpA